jgi:hypothetical protein
MRGTFRKFLSLLPLLAMLSCVGPSLDALTNDSARRFDLYSQRVTSTQSQQTSPDQQITERIRRSLLEDQTLSTDARDVRIVTRNGRVTLDGPVNSEHEKKVVEEKAEEVVGKKNVVNRLRVVPKNPAWYGFRARRGKMAGKNIAVFGIYPNRGAVEFGLGALRDGGFRSTDVSVLLPKNVGTKDLGTEKNTKAPEGATAGAGSGAVVGGALGWLVGMGALAIPGLGPLVAAGPIVAALAGIGAVGAVGAFTGALIGLGIPEYEAKRYEGRIRKGGVLLSVHSDDSEWSKKAKEILKATGAEDISSTGEASADFAKTDRPMARGEGA